MCTQDSYATLMKVRFDADFLYIGARYYQSFTWATLTGHNDKLSGGFAPYSNDDYGEPLLYGKAFVVLYRFKLAVFR